MELKICDISERQAALQEWSIPDDDWKIELDDERWYGDTPVRHLTPPEEQHDDLDRTFRNLVTRWRLETEHYSSIGRATSHPSYLAIVRLAFDFDKERVITLVLRELQKRPHYWFAVLEILTGQSFRQPDGDFKRERRAWLAWGKTKSYV